MNPSERSTLDRILPFLLGVVAFVVYVATLSGGAFPGQSAGLIAQHTHLFPKLTPSDPLWWLVSNLAAAIPLGGLATRLNVLSALCGAAAVGLMYTVLRGWVAMLIDTVPSTEARARFAARLAGVTGSGFLAVCIPFWVASNRAHTASFDALLLLTVTWMFLRYVKGQGIGSAWAFALAYGIGTAEFATLIIFAPLFGGMLVFLLWRREQLTVRNTTMLILCALAGLSLYLVGAWLFYGSDGYRFGEYTGYWNVVWLYIKEHYLFVKRSLPRVGWLIVLVTTAVPFLTSVFVARRALNEEKDWGFYLLHMVMTGIAVGLLFNVPFAPWRTLGISRLLVTPYLVTAAVFGYLAAYWYLLPSAFLGADDEPPLKRWFSRTGGGILAAIFVVLVPLSAVFNLPETDARGARFINDLARETVDNLSGRTWLVTDGSLDRHLAVAAQDAGEAIQLLDMSGTYNEVYRQYVASLFDSPRLKNMADIGLFSLVQEWLASDPEITGKVALMTLPDLWIGAGYAAVPKGMLFLGTDDLQAYDLHRYLVDQRVFWRRCLQWTNEETDESVDEGSTAARTQLNAYRNHLQRLAGLAVNNTGVFLEEAGRVESAGEAYIMARRIDPSNVSALLNLAVLIERGDAEGDAALLKEGLKSLAEKPGVRRRMWSLSQSYGYVLAPQAFVQLGLAWARSGMPGLAAAGFRRALSLLPQESRRPVKEAMADLYSVHRDDVESEALYYELLVENPKNVRALIGSASLAARQGNFAKAREFLERAQDAEAPTHVVAIELAATHLMAGNYDEARILLEQVMEVDPKSVRGLALLVGAAIEQGDLEEARHNIQRLNEMEGTAALVTILRGRLALTQNDLDAARSFFNVALALQGPSEWVLTRLVRMDLAQGRMDQAENHARELLRIRRDHALANYVMGSARILEGEYRLAEDFMRRSLEQQERPELLNDLAWLLLQRDEYEEAEQLILAALELNNTLYGVWDTLGMILMETDRLAEAEEAFDRALSLFQNDFEVFLHMAEVRVRRGNTEQARELLDMLSANQASLSPADQKTLQDLLSKSRQ